MKKFFAGLLTIAVGIALVIAYTLIRYSQKGLAIVDNNILADTLQTVEYGGIGLGVVYLLGKVGKRAINK